MIEILYGVASQAVEHYPQDRASSATYVISDLRYSEDSSDHVIASGSATLDSVSTTTDDACGYSSADPRRVPVTSTTGFVVGRRYQIADATTGLVEYFTVAAVVSGASVLSSEPLLGDYTSGATVLGLQLSAAFPDAAAANESRLDDAYPLRVVWTYTLRDGRTTKQAEQIRIVRVRHNDADVAGVMASVRQAWPELTKAIPPGAGEQLRSYVSYAMQRVDSRMALHGIERSQFMGGPAYAQCVMLRTVLHLADQGFVPGTREPEAFREERRVEYSTEIESLVNGLAGASTVDLDRSEDRATAQRSDRLRNPLVQT